MPPAGYELVDFQTIPPVACPAAQPGGGSPTSPDFPGTVHLTEISLTPASITTSG